MKKIIKVSKIFLLSIFFLWPNFSLAAINFTDGKWETTFDCDEYTLFSGILNCDNLSEGGNWTADGLQTSISSLANKTVGLGGKGARFWKGSGGDNINSGTISVDFPLPQKELWVRWYERYELGFEWNNSIDIKSLYFKATDSNPYVGYQGGDYRFYWGGNGAGTIDYPRGSGGGWDDVYPSGIADGTWHCFEIYMKMDTNGVDGVGRIWVDGVLVANKLDVNWSDNNSKPHPGWENFEFLSNQKDPGLSRPYYVDYDDMVIYNSPPQNLDSNNNPFIGPVGWVNGGDAIAPNSPMGLSIL